MQYDTIVTLIWNELFDRCDLFDISETISRWVRSIKS